MFESFIEFAQANQQVAGALTLVVGGVVSYVARSIPSGILNFIESQTITTMEVDNSDYWEGAHNFTSIREWYVENGIQWLSRSTKLEKDGRLVVGRGRHYFIYKGHFCWMRTFDLDSSGVNFNKERMEISCLSRSKQVLRDFVAETTAVKVIEKTRNKIFSIRRTNDDGVRWIQLATTPIDKDIVPLLKRETFNNITDCINRFVSAREWFDTHRVPYKRTFMFYGPPGTGKSTLTTQIASITGRDVYRMDLSYIEAREFEQLLSEVPAGSIVLFEDIHSYPSLWSDEYKNSLAGGGRLSSGISLSTFLNALSGVVPLDDLIVVMTTNYLERIDPAVYRPGRVDLLECITYLDDEAIHDWLVREYGGKAKGYKGIKFRKDLTAGEVMRLAELHREDQFSLVNDLIAPSTVTHVKKMKVLS